MTPQGDAPRLAGMEMVGWCWDDAHYSFIRHFLPYDGGEPPIREGIRPVYAPLHDDATPGRPQ